jgi:hypothetical protein
MTNKLTYREKRRQESVEKYLSGEAKRPYVLREDIAYGLKENESITNNILKSCTCQETLGKFSETFKNMFHNNLTSTQQPKTVNRNLQNKWLLDNIFDSYGNYIFCFSCIKNILNISGKRLHRLREIKHQQAKMPTIRIRKDQVLPEQIYDIVPPLNETNILVWFQNLKDSNMVELRFSPKLHCGKSNNNKEELLPQFLSFIDNNSQANGRRVGSHGPLYFFNSKFNRINTPSASEANKPENWKRHSLVYEFNRTLEGNKSISNGTAKKWLKTDRPKHAISPQKTDYCEMCAECQEQSRRHRTISIRLQQEGNGSDCSIRENQAIAESYKLLLQEHKMDASFEIEHYRQQTKKSRSLYHQFEELQKVESLVSKTNLQVLKRQIIFSLSLDYQQSKLTPHWGIEAQPSETYYLRKLSHNIFGVVDHTLLKKAVYVLDERVGGAKNANMTVSLVDHYIHQNIPYWARHLCFFMDNGATNKNQFIIQWAMELVERSDYDTIRMCFFVPGHGKNDVDRRIERISHAFDNNDVFVTNHLLTLIQETIGSTGTCIQASNRDIVDWKSLLVTKYTSLKDIKNYRDFLVKRNVKGKVVVYCKECCYTGNYIHKELLKENINEVLDLMEESKKFTYEAKGMSQNLSQEKVTDLIKMYDKFIDPSLRPSFLPISQSITTSHVSTSSSPSSDLARQHRVALKKRKKGKKESI